MKTKLAVFLGLGLLVSLLLAGVVSNAASSSPDGLDATARQGCTFDANDNITGGDCLARSEKEHAAKDSPFAGYGIKSIHNSALSTGLSGVAGVLLVAAIGGGLFWLLRRRQPAATAATAADGAPVAKPGER
ncbi:PDGLE domain-containing protein [Cryptosporangium phraense]|uniref:Cobalamin biosynthesis protein CbiM n=1 Tax=Cryptosporangium phraense TaxID=2593070 RepID=A0A545AQJ3_9ACTN|nr:PDGLE domain-containing protein [Cryptosporangium phraense]TQS43602.1 cobalamin biosynthesis protein CbiM [Cryptosporangium phraense]